MFRTDGFTILLQCLEYYPTYLMQQMYTKAQKLIIISVMADVYDSLFLLDNHAASQNLNCVLVS